MAVLLLLFPIFLNLGLCTSVPGTDRALKRAETNPVAKEEAKRILEEIAQYFKAAR